MGDVKVNSVQPSEASKELVALYLLGSVARVEGATVTVRDGIPYIDGGMTKKQILLHYADCLYAARLIGDTMSYLRKLPD